MEVRDITPISQLTVKQLKTILERASKKTLLKGLRAVTKHYKYGMPRAIEISRNKDVPKYKMGNCWYFYAEEIDEVYRVKEDVPD